MIMEPCRNCSAGILTNEVHSMDESSKPWPNCCLNHQTNGPRGAGCSVHLYTGFSAIYTRAQTEQWLRDADYFSEEGVAFVLDHPQVYLGLGGVRSQRVDDSIRAYVRGQSCPGRVQKARKTAKAFGNPFEVECDTCDALVSKPCKNQEPSALVSVLDDKWLPVLEHYLNPEQVTRLRDDILNAASEKV